MGTANLGHLGNLENLAPASDREMSRVLNVAVFKLINVLKVLKNSWAILLRVMRLDFCNQLHGSR